MTIIMGTLHDVCKFVVISLDVLYKLQIFSVKHIQFIVKNTLKSAISVYSGTHRDDKR